MFSSEKLVDNIKALCKENNVKISELEEKVGLSTGNISRWAKSCPSALTALYNIADTLNTSIDFLMDSDRRNSGSISKKENTLNTLILKTKEREVVWQKIQFPKAKKIPFLNFQNDITFNNYIFAYETVFNKQNLIFAYQKLNSSYELYIENNNEYINICSNDSFSKRIYSAINGSSKNILNDFFES